jgi:hypothetical protein
MDRSSFVHTAGSLVVVALALGTVRPALAAPQDTPDPPPPVSPASATIDAVAWLEGVWTGVPGGPPTEERWIPPSGGAMLATSRTVSGGRMVAFEFLRIVERDGTLVYIAQPNGRDPTEFVLTSVGEQRAVFENPQHDYPTMISYTLGEDGVLTARIAAAGGARAQDFRFRREAG